MSEDVEAYLAHTVAACAPSCVHCARWQAEVQARADKARRRRERMKPTSGRV